MLALLVAVSGLVLGYWLVSLFLSTPGPPEAGLRAKGPHPRRSEGPRALQAQRVSRPPAPARRAHRPAG